MRQMGANSFASLHTSCYAIDTKERDKTMNIYRATRLQHLAAMYARWARDNMISYVLYRIYPEHEQAIYWQNVSAEYYHKARVYMGIENPKGWDVAETSTED